MRLRLKLLIIIPILLVFLSATFYFINGINKNTNLVSPILKTSKTVGINQWFPKNVLGADSDAPQISAKAALFVETKSGQILYSKNIHQRMAVASLAKIMTVAVALENKGLDDQILISESATVVEPDNMELLAGEKLTVKELLYGVFLISANDAAEALSQGIVKREEFIKMMNSKAIQLGMKDSYFANPTGLDEDNNTYSTVFDLVLLSRYAIRNFPVLVDISKSDHVYLPKTENHQDYDMYSVINLLKTYPGVVGFKTGYTEDAGLTLITIARKENKEILGVLLGSENRRDEARKLLDYSFQKLR